MVTVNQNVSAFIKTTSWLIASLTYARLASSLINPSKLRLLSLLPVILLLPSLPFSFPSINLRGVAAFFLAWLAVFKLLLLAFGLGPLSPSLPLPTFIAVASLPIKIRPANKPTPASSSSSGFLVVITAVILLVVLLLFYQHHQVLQAQLRLIVFCLYICLFVELILATARFVGGSLLGLDLDPQTNSPFKSSSLQDFWGRRWNLMVTGILRLSVYRPVKAAAGTAAGVMAVFVVSGLMHEVIVYYMTGETPTGEIMVFFLIQGMGTMAEVRAKRAGWWAPHPAVRVTMTMGFVAATAFWLFIPPLVRAGADEKVLEEAAEAVRTVVISGRALLRWAIRIKLD